MPFPIGRILVIIGFQQIFYIERQFVMIHTKSMALIFIGVMTRIIRKPIRINRMNHTKYRTHQQQEPTGKADGYRSNSAYFSRYFLAFHPFHHNTGKPENKHKPCGQYAYYKVHITALQGENPYQEYHHHGTQHRQNYMSMTRCLDKLPIHFRSMSGLFVPAEIAEYLQTAHCNHNQPAKCCYKIRCIGEIANWIDAKHIYMQNHL